ncbi:hypothetical protein U1Q18_052714 [Sarracenia purpurea var. burkii]
MAKGNGLQPGENTTDGLETIRINDTKETPWPHMQSKISRYTYPTGISPKMIDEHPVGKTVQGLVIRFGKGPLNKVSHALRSSKKGSPWAETAGFQTRQG